MLIQIEMNKLPEVDRIQIAKYLAYGGIAAYGVYLVSSVVSGGGVAVAAAVPAMFIAAAIIVGVETLEKDSD